MSILSGKNSEKEVSNLKKTLGEIIKAYCAKEKISQEKFGELVGVSGRAIRFFISGLKVPSGTVLIRILQLTGTESSSVKI